MVKFFQVFGLVKFTSSSVYFIFPEVDTQVSQLNLYYSERRTQGGVGGSTPPLDQKNVYGSQGVFRPQSMLTAGQLEQILKYDLVWET